jgi:hypothetical protein
LFNILAIFTKFKYYKVKKLTRENIDIHRIYRNTQKKSNNNIIYHEEMKFTKRIKKYFREFRVFRGRKEKRF